MIKAIETTYKGYRFRSRLEARWAVFFDALGIKWQYEPEGFEKSTNYCEEDGPNRVVRYLPDFYLPESGTWVEVKGVWTEKDASDTAFILDFGSPLWHFDDSDIALPSIKLKGLGIERDVRGLLLLGDIPELSHGTCFHPIVKHNKGLRISYVEFEPGRPLPVSPDVVEFAKSICGDRSVPPDYLDCMGSSDTEHLEFFKAKQVVTEQKMAHRGLAAAYRAAKSARFEFGQSGASL